jgi:hypothetical protein
MYDWTAYRHEPKRWIAAANHLRLIICVMAALTQRDLGQPCTVLEYGRSIAQKHRDSVSTLTIRSVQPEPRIVVCDRPSLGRRILGLAIGIWEVIVDRELEL